MLLPAMRGCHPPQLSNGVANVQEAVVSLLPSETTSIETRLCRTRAVMGKTKHGRNRWPPRRFSLQSMVIILVAWGTSALSMTGAEVVIRTQVDLPCSENLGVAAFSGTFVAGLFTFLGALVLLGRIMR